MKYAILREKYDDFQISFQRPCKFIGANSSKGTHYMTSHIRNDATSCET